MKTKIYNNQENYTDILKKCINIADDRQEQYGDYNRIVQKAIDILKTVFNLSLSSEQFCHVLISLKLARIQSPNDQDSIIDCINYLAMSLKFKK